MSPFHLLLTISLSFALNPNPDFIPSSPIFPSIWSATWREQTNYSNHLKYTSGASSYNSLTNELVWTRSSGAADPVCSQSLPLLQDTECKHIVSGGVRYLYYPVLGKCCACCNSAQGCGLPATDFLSGAKFSGTGSYYMDAVYIWKTSGFTYYESQEEKPQERRWVGLFSRNDTYPQVHHWSLNVSSSEFWLPPSCNPSLMCPQGPCANVRMSGSEKSDRKEYGSSLFQDQFPFA